MQHHGWRKPTPGLVEAEKHAQAGERLDVPKKQAIVAFKKVATSLGLKPPQLMLIDTLGAITQDQDWEQGRRPIVWPSNEYLMAQCGFTLSSLKRHLKCLAEAGIVSFSDSSNGKRWGHRDDKGYIVDAYGIDLGPLAARTAEFESRHAEMVADRALCKSLHNTITISRRIIRAKIEKAIEDRLRGPWREFQLEFTDLIEKLPTRSEGSERLMNLADWFTVLKERVEDAFSQAFDWPAKSDAESSERSETANSHVVPFTKNLNPRGIIDEPHIRTTNQPDSVRSNGFENEATAETVPEPQRSVEIENSGRGELDHIKWDVGASNRTEIELPTLMAAFPEFANMARGLAGGYVRRWDDLHRSVGTIRSMCGISDDAWRVAQQKLGPYVAAAAIGLIYEKYSKQEIGSPGGYLRGIVGRALDGELHLERSIYGRLSGVGGLSRGKC